ncbi:hypothetical protein IP88_12470 [alpha proteobacterium AAP81b]|nr:hypothetical protein IP88_12470 [alpha proteobacterium AAP81b]
MSDLALLHVALLAFVGGHLLLSHPLRAPIVGAVGAGGFMGVYSLVAFASLIWAVNLWRAVPPDRLWEAPEALRWAGVVVMLLASILFVGSVAAPNPALMGGAGAETAPRGVQRITRHPMMWAFALWGIVHITLSADSRTIALGGAIIVLALVGSWLQDGKKRAQNPAYADHIARTSFVPFAGQLTGRLPWAGPGLVAGLGGLVLWVVLLGAHPHVIGASPLPSY